MTQRTFGHWLWLASLVKFINLLNCANNFDLHKLPKSCTLHISENNNIPTCTVQCISQTTFVMN